MLKYWPHNQEIDLSAYVWLIYIIKGVMFVCLLPMAGQTAGPIKTKLGIGTHVDPMSVLVKFKVKVIWRHLVNDNKTPYRGPQRPREFECEAP